MAFNVSLHIENKYGSVWNDIYKVNSANETAAQFDAVSRVLSENDGVVSVECMNVSEAS